MQRSLTTERFSAAFSVRGRFSPIIVPFPRFSSPSNTCSAGYASYEAHEAIFPAKNFIFSDKQHVFSKKQFKNGAVLVQNGTVSTSLVPETDGLTPYGSTKSHFRAVFC
jgi:hypothetical protein